MLPSPKGLFAIFHQNFTETSYPYDRNGKLFLFILRRFEMKKTKLLTAFLLAMVSSSVLADTSSGASMSLSEKKIYVASPGEVKLTFISESAKYSNDLFLNSDLTKILNSKTNTAGEIFSLGSFSEGAELVFKLFVTNTGKSFFNGPAARNADGVIHARYKYGENKQVLVGFEDLWGGGDRDYNDLIFSLSNVYFADNVLQPVPEPETYLLMGLGVLSLGWMRSKRKAG